MLVRTIGQLPRISADYSNGLFEISVPEGNVVGGGNTKYTSRSISQTTLSNGILSATEDVLSHKYGWTHNGQPLSIDGIMKTVAKLSTEDCQLSGVKTFESWPSIPLQLDTFPTDPTKYGGDVGNVIPNVNKVNDMIGNQPVYFSTTDSMVAEGNPLNAHSRQTITVQSTTGQTTEFDTSTVPESLDYATTIGNNKFYFWRIDDRDSSKSVYDTRSSTKDHYECMRDTGQLVVWGWLADNGDVSPEMAWVGLFASIKCEDAGSTQFEVPISIQPWIRGENASILQYVSFNVPVKKGLEVKIKTGFHVNQQTSGGFQNKGTMTFIDRYVPNAFFGYIVK